MTTRSVVMLAAIGLVVGAISLVAAKWPRLPDRTLPTPPKYVAMGGQATTALHTGCLAPIVAEMRKRPNHVIRVDDMRWTDYTSGDDDPRKASIFVEPGGATWRDEWLPQQTIPLTADELAKLIAGFDLRCEKDESQESSHGYEGRYIGVAYGKTEKRAAELRYKAPATLQIGEVFDAVRARYVANRAAASRSFVIKLTGRCRRCSAGPDWSKHTVEIDSNKLETDDETRVALVDWALALPASLPESRTTATGTLTMAGVTKPIAFSFDDGVAEEHLRQLDIASELTMWMSINRP